MNDEGWKLTPEGQEFAKDMMGEIMKMTGMDRIVEGVKAKFSSQKWILVEHDGMQVEVWSIADNETVTILDDEMLSNSHDKDGNLFPADDAVFMWLALRLVSARDGKDHELLPAGIRIRKWLKTLPIDSDVINGSCVDNYWREKGIETPEQGK
jgi:hypothetical protein